MKIELWYVGKTNEKYLSTGMAIYEKRLSHYCKYSSLLIKDVKAGQTPKETKQREADVILKKINAGDTLILLDELGKEYSSIQWSQQIEKWSLKGTKRLIFLIAGAFGADKSLKQRANQMVSLSKMTFSHQMIRLFFLEQLYRGFTIIKNEKYHNA